MFRTTFIAAVLLAPSTALAGGVAHCVYGSNAARLGLVVREASTVATGATARIAAVTEAATQLPRELPLGVAVIDRFEDPRVNPSLIGVAAHVPLPPKEGLTGYTYDMNAKGLYERAQDLYVIGDAGRTRAFLGVDKRPGSPLWQRIDALMEKLGAPQEEEALLQFLASKSQSMVPWTAGSSANDGRAEFAWDKAIKVDGKKIDEAMASIKFSAIGAPGVETGQMFPVVALEEYIEVGGYCVQKAMVASLILERRGIPHRLVNGAVVFGPGRTSGHSWIELADGRILDPAWNSLAAKGPADPHIPKAFRFGGRARFENPTYPYVGFPGVR